MCRMQCFLSLIALSVGVVHSWDIAITTGNQLEFYANNTKIHNVGTQFRDLTALAYDAVHNMLLFVDTQNDNASIFSYHLAGKKYQSLVRRRSVENIQGLAFDAVTSMLFWTDSSERSIFWTSLKPGSENGPYGNLLLKMDDEIPRAIAIDSCRGYVYWTNTNVSKPTIERSRFDGSERQVLVHTDIYMPVSLAIDQRTKKLYWIDDKEGIHYTIESSDLEGNNRLTMWKGIQHQPNALTVSKDAIYWIDWGFKTIWKLPKNMMDEYPEPVIVFPNDVPHGIVANYQIQDQTEGVPECENFKSLSQNKSAINDSFSVPRDRGLFCLHGVKIDGKSECKCTPGYTGNRCHISVCDNYCFQGDCSLTTDGKVGQPICSCNEGYEGDRCEINVCHGYCLNNGFCSFNENHKPVCSCSGEYEGTRCESEKLLSTTMPTEVIVSEPCNCTKNVTMATTPTLPSEQLGATDGEFVMTSSISSDGWDPIRDPVIMVLGILCGVLCLACAVLITKILQLKKRPRIKKRIIVNKNVTPLTARPDQCEITIENCCNMNICETPCFEPRSTIRPTLLESKPGKEEKRNLISNMEYPDDY